MATQASIDGISVNGFRWRARINLGHAPALLGKMNDTASEGGDVDDSEVERLAESIVANVRSFVAARSAFSETDLLRCADDLEMVADCGLDEVNFAMGELYDSFDFHRILVVRPPHQRNPSHD